MRAINKNALIGVGSQAAIFPARVDVFSIPLKALQPGNFEDLRTKSTEPLSIYAEIVVHSAS